MLTLFNRRELYMTYDMNERVRICQILSANNIDYQLKTTNPTASMGAGRHSSFGINTDYAYEYKIYVHKKDYDYALHLIHK